MKRSLLTTALITAIASAAIFAPADCLAAPPKHKPMPSQSVERQQPPESKPSRSVKPPQRQQRPMPSQSVKQRPNPRPPQGQTVKPRPNPRPSQDQSVKPRPNPRPSQGQSVKPRPNPRPSQDQSVKPRPNPRPSQDQSVKPRPNPRPSQDQSVKPHPNQRPIPDQGMKPHPKPIPDQGMKPHPKPHPQPTPPPRPHHHHHHYRYIGIFVPPIIYSGTYYDYYYDRDIVYPQEYTANKVIAIQPKSHPNIFLLNRLQEEGHPDSAIFYARFNGEAATEYDSRHGEGAFYHLSVKNLPSAKKWKSDGDIDETLPEVTCLQDYLDKYHFTASDRSLFDGKLLYKYDSATQTFVENQSIEGLTTTYKHGKLRLIHATPQETYPYPKYYLVLEDAIYESQDSAEYGYLSYHELQQDTKKLSKIIKKEKKEQDDD